MEYFVDVILPIPLEKHFTYALNAEEAQVLSPGMRVGVPFGKSKVYTALVYRVHNDPPQVYEAKPIHKILDDEPIVTPFQLKHWHWIAEYYMCTVGEVFRSAVPGAFLLESETLVLRNTEVDIDESDLEDDEFLVFEALQHQSSLKVHEVGAIVDRKNVLPILNRLIQKNVILLKEEIYEQYKPKLVKFVKLGKSYLSEAKLEALAENPDPGP